MRRLTAAIGLLILSGSAICVEAQDKPFEINMDRVKVTGGDRWGDSQTYFIPTFYLLVSAKGSAWAQKSGAQAHAKFWLDGLDRPYLQGLARKLYDDLVTKMRAAGYTVLTYEDMKSDPTMSHDLMDPDKKLGMPTKRDHSGPTIFVLATPTDEQAFGYGITGPVWPYRGVAKAKQLVALVPEAWFTAPQVSGETEEGYKRFSAGINFSPALMLQGATTWAINPKQAGFALDVDQHGKRLASENVGSITKLSEDKIDFSPEWKRTSGDFTFTVDRAAMSAGILRVGYALNDLTVSTVKKAHK